VAAAVAGSAQQGLRLFQIGRAEAFGEPAVDWGEQVAGFGAAALITPQARQGSRGAQFPHTRRCLRATSSACSSATSPSRPARPSGYLIPSCAKSAGMRAKLKEPQTDRISFGLFTPGEGEKACC
jgi:hypothetical protein